MSVDNLFADLPDPLPEERVDVLVQTGEVRLERIVSRGHGTPAGRWYDSGAIEWVALLRGRAGLRFADEPEVRVLGPGDCLTIPAHRRHRVEWTDPAGPTVWLALHYPPST